MSNSVLEMHNTDDILIRNVIGGVLSIMNNNINYDQVWDKDIVENVTLPWFFDMGNSSSERFMQDNFTYFGEKCFKKIDGTFDMLPRGVLSYQGTTIDSANITNRFVEGKYTKFNNGKLTSYKVFLYSIPLTLKLKATIYVDTFGNLLKIEQGLREELYRNKTFYVMFRGMKIGCCMGMPDDYNAEKTIEYSFATESGEQRLKIDFDIVVETYQPVFDKTTEVPSDCVMNGIGFDVTLLPSETEKNDTDNNTNNDVIVNVKVPNLKYKNISLNCDKVMVGGITSIIKWDYKSESSDGCGVILDYRKYIEDGKEIIGDYKQMTGVIDNQSDYYWDVPKELSSNSVKYNIIFNEEENVQVIKEPIIKVLPINGKLTNDSFIIIDPGYFLVSNANEEGESFINISLSYKKNNRVSKLKRFGKINLKWNKIDEDNPIELVKEVDFEDIKDRYKIRITDATNPSVYSVVDDIIIL